MGGVYEEIQEAVARVIMSLVRMIIPEAMSTLSTQNWNLSPVPVLSPCLIEDVDRYKVMGRFDFDDSVGLLL